MCRLCGVRHWRSAPHAFAAVAPDGSVTRLAVNTAPRAEAVNSRGRYPNTDHRRAYMRDYMARRRA